MLAPAMGASKVRVVLVAHGSRKPAWREPLDRMAARIAETTGPAGVRVCFLEKMEPGFDTVLDEAAADGVAHLRVLPMFMAPGLHTQQDIIVQRSVRTPSQCRRSHPRRVQLSSNLTCNSLYR